MKKLLSVLVAFMAFCTLASAQNVKKVCNISGTINIHAAASTSSRILRQWKVDDGYDATFISASGNWYKVNYRGTIGYVHFSTVHASSEGYSGDRVTSHSEKGYTTIRKGPSKSSPAVGKLPNYGTAKHLGTIGEGEWYKLSYNGIVGYCDGADVSTMW